MNKTRIIAALLIVLVIAAASVFMAFREVAGAKYDCYNLCENIAVTSNGRIYVVYEENGVREIIEFDSNGSVTNMSSDIKRPFESNIKNSLGLFNCEGDIFGAEFVVGGSGDILRQTIYSLGDDLSAEVFYTYNNGGAKAAYITSGEGKLFVTLLDAESRMAFVDVFELDGDGPASPAERLEFASPFNDRFYEALYLNGSLYASTMSGEVLRCFEGGAVNILQSPAHGGDIACGVIEALGSDGKGVFFYDAMDGFYYYIDSAARLNRRENPVARQGEHTYALAESGSYRLALITGENADIMRISHNDNVVELNELQPKLRHYVKILGVYALFYLAIGCAAALLVFILIKLIKKVTLLLIKFLLIITPFTLVAFALFGYSQNTQLKSILLAEKYTLSQYYNRLVTSVISYGDLEAIKSPQAYKSPEYQRLLDKLQTGADLGGGSAPAENDVFILRDGELLTGASLKYPCLSFAKDLLAADKLKALEECDRRGQPYTFDARNLSGKWSITVSVIDNGDYAGPLKGYVMTWVSQNDIVSMLNGNIRKFAALALIIIIPLVVLLAVIFKIALRPISNLHGAVRQVLAGDYEVRLNASTKDEFMQINLAFNKMCSDLKTQMYKLGRINDSYYRFVPRNILPILNKKSILEVGYGDSMRLSVCCCALCVHNLSDMQAAGPDEDFLEYMGMISNFINDSLKRCGGVLMSSEIDLRGLLAIFPASADACRQFASDMRQFCSMERAKFVKTSPKITAIIHYADMLYGITGVSDAAFPFLLSDGVDFVMRTLPLFESAQAHIVITQDILPQLEDRRVMEIGWRTAPDGEKCKLYVPADMKTAWDDKFSEGIEAFYKKDFYNARALFSSVWREKPGYEIAQWYALAADKYLAYPHQFVSCELFGTDIYQIDF